MGSNMSELIRLQNWFAGGNQRLGTKNCFSDRRLMSSGSLMASQVFVMYINDLNENVNGKISKCCR